MNQTLSSLLSSTYADRVRNSTYLSIPHKYLYIDTPKAACTTLKRLIAAVEGIPEGTFRESLALDSKISMLVHDRSLFDLPSLGNVAPEMAEESLVSKQYFRFCFVRNPYSRLFSAWQSKMLLREPYFLVNFDNDRLIDFSRADSWNAIRQSFRRFVLFLNEAASPPFSDPHWALQCNLIFKGKINYDLVGRTETFAKDIRLFYAHLARNGIVVDKLNLHQSNSGVLRDWRWFYDPDTLALVQAMYQEDFREFNFDREVDEAAYRQPLPNDAADPQVSLWIEEIAARNEMIVLLRSRLMGRIDEVTNLKRQLAELRCGFDGSTSSLDHDPAVSSGLWSRIIRHLRRPSRNSAAG